MSAANLRRLLMRLADPRVAPRVAHLVQDAYSLRCAPQVRRDPRRRSSLARAVLAIEINSVSDNPIVLPDGPRS